MDNLISAEDSLLSRYDNYLYDEINRITNIYRDINNTSNAYSYYYNKLGDITSSTKLGNYTYINDELTQAGNKTYQYDNTGNQIQNDTYLISYSSTNKPTLLSNGSNTIEFSYDSEDKRYIKTYNNIDTYLDKEYELYQNEHRYYIYMDGKAIALFKDDSISQSLHYLHSDHIDSITYISDENGAIVEDISYDSFGESNSTFSITNRGYTGHEHIENTKFIHMNARIYDSKLSRFISADPIVPFPYDTQAYNRYAYVKNNPLILMDPTGHGWLSDRVKVVKKKVKEEAKHFESKHRDELKKGVIAMAVVATAVFTGNPVYMSGARVVTTAMLYGDGNLENLKVDESLKTMFTGIGEHILREEGVPLDIILGTEESTPYSSILIELKHIIDYEEPKDD